MPAVGARVVFELLVNRQTVTEVHVLQSASAPTEAVDAAVTLFKKRMALTGFGVVPLGIRISQYGKFRQSLQVDPLNIIGLIQPFNTTKTPPNPITGLPSELVGNEPDIPNSSILLRAYSQALSQKSIFLGGCPDFAIREQPAGPIQGVPPSYLILLKKYISALIDGQFGWIGKTQPTGAFANFQVTSMLTDGGTALFGVGVPTALVTFAAGDKVQLRNFLMQNQAYTPANGKWMVQSVQANTPGAGINTYLLWGSQKVLPANVKTPGTIQKIDFSNYPYTAINIDSQTTRKRGGSLFLPRGRRKTLKRV